MEIPVEQLPEDLVTEEVAAQFLGLKPGTLRQYRARRKGPRYYRVPEVATDSRGRQRAWYRVYYSRADLEAWQDNRRGFALRKPVLVDPTAAEPELDPEPTLPLDV